VKASSRADHLRPKAISACGPSTDSHDQDAAFIERGTVRLGFRPADLDEDRAAVDRRSQELCAKVRDRAEQRRPIRAHLYVVGFYDEPHFMWSTGRVGHIDSFYVLPELRGRGVGRLLMEAAYAEMRQAGATTVALEMVANNDVARRFYEREGFTTTFVQMHRRLGPA